MWIGIAVVIGIIVFFVNPTKDFSSILSSINKAYMPSIIVAAFVGIIGFIVTDPSLTKVEKDRVWIIVIFTMFIVFFWWAFEQAGGSMTVFANDYTDRDLVGNQAFIFNLCNTILTVVPMIVITWVLIKLFKTTYGDIPLSNIILGLSFLMIWIIIYFMLAFEWGLHLGFAEQLGLDIDPNKTEVAASWFGILNSFFIIAFAPLFSKFWDTKIITSGPIKFAMGLGLLAIGFALLAWGSNGIPQGAKTASVSMVWLILAYLFHTLGELCISPVGLAYVSKLAPVRLIGLMFGVFFLANFLANWAGGMTGSYIDQIVEKNSMTIFFLIFTVIPGTAALILVIINKWMQKKMHGIL